MSVLISSTFTRVSLTFGVFKMELMKYTAEMPVVDFAPAQVLVSGKTLADKKMSVVEQASHFTLAALVAEKGKLGAAARNGMAMDGLCRIASMILRTRV